MRRYEASMYDSSRWDGFELRPGDIIISTPPKCGTTWTQMICALLILQEPELPLPLDTLSPWIDMVTRARTEVFADLEAQTHRRFIKTHTPLDGIPSDPAVTYICAGRDPRDVGLSMDRHIGNTDIGAFSANVNGRPRSTVSSPGHCGHRGRAPAASGTASGSGPTTRRRRRRPGRRCGALQSTWNTYRLRAKAAREAGYWLGSDRGSPNHGSTLASKRVRAQIWPPARVST